MINRHPRSEKGFTIIELMLVMAFIALLMMAVLMTTIYVSKIYTKGITLKNINTAGRSVVDTMRRDFAASRPSDIKVVFVPDASTAQNGRICLSGVTYAWNTAAQLTSGGQVFTRNANPAHLVRIVAPTGNYCERDGTGKYPLAVTAADQPSSSELLSGDGTDFAIYTLKVEEITSATLPQQLRAFDIEIGTNQSGTTIQLPDGRTACKTASDSAANFDYCSVAAFSTVLRIGSGSS